MLVSSPYCFESAFDVVKAKSKPSTDIDAEEIKPPSCWASVNGLPNSMFVSPLGPKMTELMSVNSDAVMTNGITAI